jgi:primosomal protein N''
VHRITLETKGVTMQQSQEMQAVHQQLQETLQTLHRKAVDADQILDSLQRDQKGKFAAVFADDSGFSTSAKRFGPYVQEIANDWQSLKELDDDAAKQALAPLVKKIELALVTIAQFQQSLSKN